MSFICIKDDNGIVVLPDLGGPEWFLGKVRFTLWKQLKTADFPPLTGLPLWFGYSKGSFFFTNFQSPIPYGARKKKIWKSEHVHFLNIFEPNLTMCAAPHIVWFCQKMFRKWTCSNFQKFFFPGSVWYWRLEISDKTWPLYAQCTVVFIEPEQTQLFSADFIR